eukprot:3594507-Prymnesium_polylepis.2
MALKMSRMPPDGVLHTRGDAADNVSIVIANRDQDVLHRVINGCQQAWQVVGVVRADRHRQQWNGPVEDGALFAGH